MLCDDAQPVIHAPWKCPIAIHPRVKAELDKMVKLGVITPVDEPTDWVSSVAYLGQHLVSYTSVWILVISIMPFTGTITAHSSG